MTLLYSNIRLDDDGWVEEMCSKDADQFLSSIKNKTSKKKIMNIINVSSATVRSNIRSRIHRDEGRDDVGSRGRHDAYQFVSSVNDNYHSGSTQSYTGSCSNEQRDGGINFGNNNEDLRIIMLLLLQGATVQDTALVAVAVAVAVAHQDDKRSALERRLLWRTRRSESPMSS